MLARGTPARGLLIYAGGVWQYRGPHLRPRTLEVWRKEEDPGYRLCCSAFIRRREYAYHSGSHRRNHMPNCRTQLRASNKCRSSILIVNHRSMMEVMVDQTNNQIISILSAILKQVQHKHGSSHTTLEYLQQIHQMWYGHFSLYLPCHSVGYPLNAYTAW